MYILCKIKDNIFEDDKFADYIGLRTDVGLNSHTMVYGASGAGKSRGFVKPFILKMEKFKADKRESMILVDPKGEFFESMSEFLRNQGYVVKAFNLLDMENSDGWNCIGEIGNDTDTARFCGKCTKSQNGAVYRRPKRIIEWYILYRNSETIKKSIKNTCNYKYIVV